MRLAALGLFCALTAPAADMLEGGVRELVDGEPRPLAKALVSLAPEGRGPVRSMTRSDSQGRWRIGGPLDGRYVVQVTRPGYFVVEADGASSSSVLIDCSGACGPVDFTLQRGGVVSGVVEDDQGEPIQNVSVSLASEGTEREEEPARGRQGVRGRQGFRGRLGGGPRAGGGDRTDDLGRFRISGLRPGRYDVVVQFFGRPDSAHYELAAPVEVDVAVGEETSIRLTAVGDRSEALRVSGVVTGVDLSREGRHMLYAQPDGNAARRSRMGRRMFAIGEGGRFELDGLPPGRYFFSYSYFPNRSSGQQTPLGSAELRRNMGGLTLSPTPTVTLAGRFELDSDEDIQGASVMLVPNDGSPATSIYRTSRDNDFHRDAILPGTYHVVARSQDWFLDEVRIGDEVVDPEAVPIGTNVDDFVIRLSDRFARVIGRLRPAEARYDVTLSSGPIQESRPTDQNGGFVFERLPPGDFAICVRPVDSSRDTPCLLEREFPAEAGAVIELELSLP